MSILELNNISYKYSKKSPLVLNNVSYNFNEGQIYSIIGKSGAGKTTLLSLISGLTKPTGGKIYYNNKDISNIDRYKFRSECVGVVFQNFNLLPYLTAVENVILSMDIAGVKVKNKKEEAEKLLQKVKLEKEDINRRVLLLSGGQQQRVAIARALSFNPKIILADEPTGNLDIETQNEIMQIFKMLAKEGKCIIIVTHSPEVAGQSDTVYRLIKS